MWTNQPRKPLPASITGWLKATACNLTYAYPPRAYERLSGQVLPANFHPGSACCLSSYYRVFDEETGVKWHVPISACKVVGLGSALEPGA